MPEEQNPNPEPEGISEDDLRTMIGEVVEEKLSSITDGIGGIADSILEKLKGEGGTTSEEGLLEKIGSLFDEKIKNIPSGGNGGDPKPHEPKIRIFG